MSGEKKKNIIVSDEDIFDEVLGGESSTLETKKNNQISDDLLIDDGLNQEDDFEEESHQIDSPIYRIGMFILCCAFISLAIVALGLLFVPNGFQITNNTTHFTFWEIMTLYYPALMCSLFGFAGVAISLMGIIISLVMKKDSKKSNIVACAIGLLFGLVGTIMIYFHFSVFDLHPQTLAFLEGIFGIISTSGMAIVLIFSLIFKKE